MRLALLLLTLTVCWTNAQSTIANGTLNYALLNQSSLINGLVSYWKLDEAGTGTRYDSWGKNDLTAVNSPSYAAGKVGNAATFASASSQYLTGPTNIASDRTLGLTVTAWVKLNTIFKTHQLVTKFGDATKYEWALTYYAGSFRTAASKTGSDIYVSVSSFGTVNASTWYFLVMYWDKASSSLGISVNNGTADINTNLTSLAVTSAQLMIGWRDSLPVNESLDGSVDEVGIWNRVLTSTEISALYKSGTGCTYPSFSHRSQPLDFDWDCWQPLQLPEQIPVAFVNRKPTLISLCE